MTQVNQFDIVLLIDGTCFRNASLCFGGFHMTTKVLILTHRYNDNLRCRENIPMLRLPTKENVLQV
jgi:hypothetical protein